MKNKLIISSTLAVIVLVLAGISPVVGYNSARSSMRDSPLFSVRTSRAIKEDSNELTCNYIGKGNIWSFPKRDSRTALLQQAIDRISKMDDKSFDRFIDSIIKYQLMNNDAIQQENIREMLRILYQLKDNPNEATKYIVLLEFVIYSFLIVLLLTIFIPIFLYYIWTRTLQIECEMWI